jgi:two-component system response regulator NreC
MTTTARVLLVDDNQDVIDSIRNSLEAEDGMKVAGEANSAEEAIAQLADAQPNIVILDISLPNMSGVQAARQILKDQPDMKIMLLSGHIYDQHIRAAQRAGIHGVLNKEASDADLLAAIKTIVAGGTVFPS